MDDTTPPSNGPSPTDAPLPGAELGRASYTLGLNFHPPIKLDRKKGFEFAAKLSAYIDPQSAQIADQAWVFGQQIGEHAAGGLNIVIAQQQIQFNFNQISHRLEWIEQRCEAVLKIFEAQFKPQLLLLAAATMQGVLPVDGDARSFLATRLLHVKPERLNKLGRPLHMLGMKFFLPPFALSPVGAKPKKARKAKPVAIKWGVEVRVESLMEDPTQLFIEASANWGESSAWGADTIGLIVSHLATVSDYVENDLLKFLRTTEEE